MSQLRKTFFHFFSHKRPFDHFKFSNTNRMFCHVDSIIVGNGYILFYCIIIVLIFIQVKTLNSNSKPTTSSYTFAISYLGFHLGCIHVVGFFFLRPFPVGRIIIGCISDTQPCDWLDWIHVEFFSYLFFSSCNCTSSSAAKTAKAPCLTFSSWL